MDSNLPELQELNGRKRIVRGKDGKEFTLVPLSPGDIADAAEYLLQLRVNRFLDNPRTAALEAEVVSKTMAEIYSQKISLIDVIYDRTGALFVLAKSISQSSGKKITVDGVKAMMDSVSNDVWLPMLCDISGISLAGKTIEDGETPLSGDE